MDKALKLLERSRATWKRLADANPAVTWFQTQEGMVLNSIGATLYRSGKDAEALPRRFSARWVGRPRPWTSTGGRWIWPKSSASETPSHSS